MGEGCVGIYLGLTPLIDNNRVTIDWCLFGRITTKETNANVSSTYPYEQCRDQCALIEGASDYIIKAVPQRWDWCEYNGNYKANAQQCTSCLYNATGLTILGNSKSCFVSYQGKEDLTTIL